MTTLSEPVTKLCDALAACHAMPDIPPGLRKSMDNLQRALRRKCATLSDSPSADTSSAPASAQVSSSGQEQVTEENLEEFLDSFRHGLEESREEILSLKQELRELLEGETTCEGTPLMHAAKGDAPGTNRTPQSCCGKKAEHCLTRMPPAQSWFIYIDESGQGACNSGGGNRNCVVAVCMRGGEQLPPLQLHCAEASTSRVLGAFAELLGRPCGILGLLQSSLDVQGWLQSVLELVRWVWRLLPLPVNGHPSQLCIRIEQRGSYSPKTETGFGIAMLQAELAKEDPERAKKIRVQTLDFVSKDDPRCAWADVAAYCWQNGQDAVRTAMQDSGLLESCLVRLTAPVLSICQDVMTGREPDAAEWQQLMKASLQPGLILSHVLELLQQRCLANPDLWTRYVQGMRDYLLGEQYEMPVLEAMIRWFSPMRTDDIATRFFWLSTRLAHCNHRGEAVGDELNEVKSELVRLAPQRSTIDPAAKLHVALLLAESDANAFSFARAEDRLEQWNPDKGGRLLGTALWDGRVLGRLGQYRAFQRDLAGACHLFRQALDQFARLPKDEARKHSAQTQSALAIVSMDRSGVDDDEVRRLVEAALGQDISSFVVRMVGPDGLANREGHYLLTRYLSRRGTKKERALYLARNGHWTNPGSGFASGRPWPLIQYHRWLMVDRDDVAQRKALTESVVQILGDMGPTVELLVCAVLLSMGERFLHGASIGRRLHTIAAMLPDSEDIVRKLLAEENQDELLAQRVLPFSYC